MPLDTVRIQSLNIVLLSTHIRNLRADQNLMAFDILCLQETHILPPATIELNNKTLTSSYGKHGLPVYTRQHAQILNTKTYVEIGIKIVHLTATIKHTILEILTLYKAPNIKI